MAAAAKPGDSGMPPEERQQLKDDEPGKEDTGQAVVEKVEENSQNKASGDSRGTTEGQSKADCEETKPAQSPKKSDQEKQKSGTSPKGNVATKPKLSKGDSEAMRRSDNKPRQKESSIDWPNTLAGFGYAFNEEGVMQDIGTGGPFNFMFSDDDYFNQKRYEAIGEVITDEVYKLLETRGGLKRIYIPEETKPTEPKSFIFVSDDVKDNPDKLMVLIHGSGVVRAGQWTRKLIINNSLDHGTQLPFIWSAMQRGYAVVVLNTNLNSVVVKGGTKKKIPKNGSPEEHSHYVWNNIIKKAKAKKIAIVAHSYGGVCAVSLAREFREDFQKRVFAVAFTDSVHMMSLHNVKRDTAKRFEKVAINWCASDKPRDTPLPSYGGDARRVSAGHTKHEWTSWASHDSIFKFFDDMEKTGTNTIGVELADEVKADDEIQDSNMDTNLPTTVAEGSTQNEVESNELAEKSKLPEIAGAQAMDTAEGSQEGNKSEDSTKQSGTADDPTDTIVTTSSDVEMPELIPEASTVTDDKQIQEEDKTPDEMKEKQIGQERDISQIDMEATAIKSDSIGGEKEKSSTEEVKQDLIITGSEEMKTTHEENKLDETSKDHAECASQQEKEEQSKDSSNMETETEALTEPDTTDNPEEQTQKRSKVQEEL